MDLSTAWSLIASFETLWVLLIAVFLVLERRPPASTIAWILLFAFLPLLGLAVYFFFGPRRLVRRRVKYRRAREEVERRLLAAPVPARFSRDVTDLMHVGNKAGRAPLRTAIDVTPYRSGRETYHAIGEAIRAAKHHVHVEYYIFARDRTGTWLRDLLIEKARAGVEVRLVYDALGCGGALRMWRFFAPLREAGADVHAFNPARLAPRVTSLLNFRTHRKIVVCDGTVGFTGGINVCDDHSDEHCGDRAWRDTHVRLEGEAVRGLQRTFFENWAFASGKSPPQRDAYFPEQPTGEHAVQILSSGPDDTTFAIHAFTFAAIATANERVWLTTPYLVPDEPMLAALRSAVQRGVDVRVLVPLQGDSALVTAAARSYYEELCQAGVKLYEFLPCMLHAKTLVIDRDLAVIGTANFDTRSFRLNFEVVAVLYGAPIADRLAAWFEEDLDKSRTVRGRVLADLPLPRRLFESAARLMSPIL